MPVCPYCRTFLSGADLEAGQCPLCSGRLHSDPAVIVSDPDRNHGTAGEERVAATIEDLRGRPLPPSQQDAGKITADEHVDATIFLGPSAQTSPEPAAVDPTMRTENLRPNATVALTESDLARVGAEKDDRLAHSPAATGARGFSGSDPDLAIHPRVLADSHLAQRSDADYELQGLLGRGGMGVVLAARQASIDR